MLRLRGGDVTGSDLVDGVAEVDVEDRGPHRGRRLGCHPPEGALNGGARLSVLWPCRCGQSGAVRGTALPRGRVAPTGGEGDDWCVCCAASSAGRVTFGHCWASAGRLLPPVTRCTSPARRPSARPCGGRGSRSPGPVQTPPRTGGRCSRSTWPTRSRCPARRSPAGSPAPAPPRCSSCASGGVLTCSSATRWTSGPPSPRSGCRSRMRPSSSSQLVVSPAPTSSLNPWTASAASTACRRTPTSPPSTTTWSSRRSHPATATPPTRCR